MAKKKNTQVVVSHNELVVGEWGLTVAEAELALDEQGTERLEKRKRAIEKKRRKHIDLMPAYDEESVKRTLLLYRKYVDDGTGGYRKAVNDAGAKNGDVLTALAWDADAKTVFDFVHDRFNKVNELAHQERLMEAQEAQRRLLTEDGCELSAKMAMFTLENLDRKNYGERAGARGDGGESGAQTVYKLSGVTINMIPIQEPPQKTVEVIDGECS